MSQTISVRLSDEIASWLEETAARTGVSQGHIVRDQLERARNSNGRKAFMRLAGVMHGLPPDLSKRRGFCL